MLILGWNRSSKLKARSIPQGYFTLDIGPPAGVRNNPQFICFKKMRDDGFQWSEIRISESTTRLYLSDCFIFFRYSYVTLKDY